MFTSYYDNISNITYPTVGISGWMPAWYTGPTYRKLAPKYKTCYLPYINGEIDSQEYAARYTYDVLNKLNPSDVYRDLSERGGQNAVLLCYEKPDKFCHRHLVAQWLNLSLGIKITELNQFHQR